MWVYLRDVNDENRFHNYVGESDKALVVRSSKNELLQIVSIETELDNTVAILIFNSTILFTVA